MRGGGTELFLIFDYGPASVHSSDNIRRGKTKSVPFHVSLMGKVTGVSKRMAYASKIICKELIQMEGLRV